jgi:preprotein translocase subunit Sec61beta
MNFYTGFGSERLKVSPTNVLVLAFGFMAVVVILHIAARFKAIASKA